MSRQTPLLIRLLVWGLIAVSIGVELWHDPALLRDLGYQIWLAGLTVFAVSSTLVCRSCMTQERVMRALLVTGLQSICVMVMAGAHPTGSEDGLLAFVAFQVGLLVNWRAGAVWVAAQTAGYLAARQAAGAPADFLWQAIGPLAFQILALSTSHFWAAESRARKHLLQANAELRLSKDVLASTSRLAERQRISRELHDLLGHHLTAIGLNLEVANHLTSGKAQEHVGTALDLSHRLLNDVREAVSSMRQDPDIDL